MKVYSWKTLISTILIGGALIIYQIKRIMAGDSLSYLYLLLWIYLIFEGLLVSFTREGYGEDCFRQVVYTRATRKLFGPWAPFVSWVGFAIIVLAGIIAKFMPNLDYLPVILLFIGLIYNLIVSITIRKQIKIDKKDYFY